MSEQEKKQQRNSDLLKLKTKPNMFLSSVYKTKEKITEKEVFKEKREWWIEPKRKGDFLMAIATAIKKDSITSIRKHTNELKVYEKTVRIAIKHNLKLRPQPTWLRYMGCFR